MSDSPPPPSVLEVFSNLASHNGGELSSSPSTTLCIADTKRPEIIKSQENLEKACQDGLRHLVLLSPISFRDSINAALEWIGAIRECTALGVQVSWSLDNPPFPLEHLFHLIPPTRLEGGDEADLLRWKEQHRYGSFYFRLGPGFISVRDTRSGGNGIDATVLTETRHQDVFHRALSPILKEEAETLTRAELESARLIVCCGEYMLTLPYRIRNWPVPYRAV